MANAEARELIGQLRARGLSGAEIERRLGRGRGMVSQIERGARGSGYGGSLIGALRQLVGGAEYAEPPRRVTAEGMPARVRRSAKAELPGGNIQYETKRGYKTLRREIEAAGAKDKQVGVTITARHVEGGTLSRTESGDVEVDLFSFNGHGGYDAESFLDRLEAAGYDENPRRAIESIAAQRGLEITGIRQITITTQSKKG